MTISVNLPDEMILKMPFRNDWNVFIHFIWIKISYSTNESEIHIPMAISARHFIYTLVFVTNKLPGELRGKSVLYGPTGKERTQVKQWDVISICGLARVHVISILPFTKVVGKAVVGLIERHWPDFSCGPVQVCLPYRPLSWNSTFHSSTSLIH